ncbi:MAG: hypothetical protein IT384_32910 [Deltaproteobacteria bacterium]|nr:hypothetical protein [Deltaproteobacteria bacterium]
MVSTVPARCALTLAFLWIAPLEARAQSAVSLDTDVAETVSRRAPELSAVLAEELGQSTFHLVARWTFADDTSLLRFDPRAQIRLGDFLAVTFGLPFAADVTHQSSPRTTAIFLGNLRAGLAGGAPIRLTGSSTDAQSRSAPILIVAGALDLYAPTAGSDRTTLAALAHPAEPAAFLPHSFGGRIRLQVGLQLGPFATAAELGFTPVARFEPQTELDLWIGGSYRARVRLFEVLEPFFEISGAAPIAQATPALTLPGSVIFTPGVRVHLPGVSPAVFVDLQAGEQKPGTVTVGIDLAGGQRPSPRVRESGFDL